jgi:DNA polymerase-3 subunit delta
MAARKSIKEILVSINDYPLSPIYTITGEESYLRKTAIDLVLKKRDSSEDDPVNIIKIFGDEADPDNLNIELASYSLFSERKFVVIRNARKMAADCWSVIENYIESPSELTILIIEDEKFDGRNKTVKLLMKNSVVIDFPRMYERDVKLWLRSYVGKQGYSFSNEAVEYLMSSIGLSLWNYVQEFEKIRLFTGENKNIEIDELISITQATRSFNVFEFTEALFDSNSARTFKLLNKIFIYNESIPGIIVMIIRHLITLLKIKLYSNQNLNPKDFDIKTGLIRLPFNIKPKYKKQAAQFSVEDIKQLFEALLDADTKLKTGRQQDKMILTLLINEFINAAKTDSNYKFKKMTG